MCIVHSCVHIQIQDESKKLNPLQNYDNKQEGHDGPVWLHWLTHKIPSYQCMYVCCFMAHRQLWSFSGHIFVLKDKVESLS